MRGLTIEDRQLSDEWMSLSVEGEIDLATVGGLQEAIDRVAENGGSHLVVDLTKSSFMDSTGLKTLVMANRRFDDEGRSFAIAVKRGPIALLIDLSGVDATIRVVEDPSEVLG